MKMIGNSQERKKGFTLAEVLVTLAVIGIVAALTIPALVTNYQDKSFKTKFKKVYAVLYQSTKQLVHDHNNNIEGVYPAPSSEQLRTDLGNYLKYIELCTYNDTTVCFTYYGTFNNPGADLDPQSGCNAMRSAILTNGSTIVFCATTACTDPNAYCAYFKIDVNNVNEPNVVGRDIFFAYLYQNELKPRGWDVTEADLNGGFHGCWSGGSGTTCATKVLRNIDY